MKGEKVLHKSIRKAKKLRRFTKGRQAAVLSTLRTVLPTLGTHGFDSELKYSDNSAYSVAIGNSTTMGIAPVANASPDTSGSMVTVYQGTSPQQRIGNKITIKSLRVSGTIFQDPISIVSALGYFDYKIPVVSYCIVVDTQANGTTPTLDLVYYNPSGVLIGTTSPLRNLDYIKRFKVLKFETINFEHTQSRAVYDEMTGNSINIPRIEIKFDTGKLKLDLPQTYATADTSRDNSAVQDNNVYMFIWKDDATTTVKYTWNSRSRFVG